jgi:hypothetical protein
VVGERVQLLGARAPEHAVIVRFIVSVLPLTFLSVNEVFPDALVFTLAVPVGWVSST